MKLIYKILRIAFGLFCVSVAFDKFFPFLDDCTLYATTPKIGLYIFGIFQFAIGLALILNKYVDLALKTALGIFLVAIIMHLINNTYDIGGAVFLGFVAIALLILRKRL